MRLIKQLTTELTFRCNAKCPACHRQRIDKINLNDPAGEGEFYEY